MGLMNLFRRKPVETRSSGAGYTAQVMAARASFIGGASGLGELSAAVQSSVTLWEGGLSLADVKGTDLLSPRALAMAARGLALRGEAVFLIRDRLVPASDWDVTTRDGLPGPIVCRSMKRAAGDPKSRLRARCCTSASAARRARPGPDLRP